MMYYLSDAIDRDHRCEYACIRYILERCCPYKKENDTLNTYIVYQNMEFIQLKWILDRCNFEAAKQYGLVLFDYNLLFILEDADLKPSTFDLDWVNDYETDERGYFKKNKKGDIIKKKVEHRENYTYMDWLSEADKHIMKKIIRRWKLYGKMFQKISDWWWIHVTDKLRKRPN